MNKRLILSISCLMLTTVLCVLLFAGNESEINTEAEQHYEKAYELRKVADYAAAISEYEKVTSLSPNSKIAQNAQYWIGQSYFESKQFDTALSAFQDLLDKYPASSIAPSTKQMIDRVQQAKKNRALFEAVKEGDIEQVRSRMSEGAEVDAKWGDMSTKEEQKKAKAEHLDATPLYYAVDSNNIDVVKLLVEAGTDVNAGQTPPLCKAVYVNNTEIAGYLIDHGANVNPRKDLDSMDWGPLQIASSLKSNNIDMVKLLIARGADINAAGFYTALQMSVGYGRKDIFDLLIQLGADVNARGSEGHTALYWAVHEDDSYFMNTLIANGADVNTKHPGGETPLQSAAITGRTEAVKLLLEAGANVNAKDDNGQTALHLPLDIRNFNDNKNKYRLSKDTIELLLANGADVNLKDNDGRTPLHLAGESADTDIVALLLDKGADINAKDNEGHTPLYVAVNHDYKIAEFLINKGADSSIETKTGQTLGQLAQQRKQAESPVIPDMIFDGEPNSLFGSPIACGDIDGDGYDDMLIGAVSEDNSRGRVYLFYGGPDLNTTADLILEGQNKNDWFGSGIVCGDIDNDGHDDIIIAASGYSEQQGRVYLFWGSDRNYMDAAPDKIFVGEKRKGERFGESSPAIYDIDNDGYCDIILSSYTNQDDQLGRVYLYYGNKKDLIDTSADQIFTAENPSDQYLFGRYIACGDVDNDNYGDIVIGSTKYHTTESNDYPKSSWIYRADLYYGDSRSNMDAKADVIFEIETEFRDYRGNSIACVDQNRGGYEDIVIGASGYNARQGRIYLFQGNSRSNIDTDPDMILDGEAGGCGFGHNIVCGDINGDHSNDLIISASAFRQGTGSAYVYLSNELTATDPKPGRILKGENSMDFFSQGSACGDINKDGFDDLVIGAHGYRKDGVAQGRAYLYYGGSR